MVVNTDFTSSFSTTPRILFFNQKETTKYLQFDGRELISITKRTLIEGIYNFNSVHESEIFVVNNGTTALVLDVLDKRYDFDAFYTSIDI